MKVEKRKLIIIFLRVSIFFNSLIYQMLIKNNLYMFHYIVVLYVSLTWITLVNKNESLMIFKNN